MPNLRRWPLFVPLISVLAGLTLTRTDLFDIHVAAGLLLVAVITLLIFRQRLPALLMLAAALWGVADLLWDAHQVHVDASWLNKDVEISADVEHVEFFSGYRRYRLHHIRRSDGVWLPGKALLYQHNTNRHHTSKHHTSGHRTDAGYIRLQTEKQIQAGQRIQLRVHWRLPRNYDNPGSFDYRAWCFDHHIALIGSMKGDPKIIRAAIPWLQQQRQKVRAVIHRVDMSHKTIQTVQAVPAVQTVQTVQAVQAVQAKQTYKINSPNHDAAGILQAVLLGERSQLSSRANALFSTTGTAHLLAISGMHVGMAAAWALMLVWFILTRREAWIVRLPVRHISVSCGFLAAAAYAALAGWPLPAVRAAIMLAAAALAWCLTARSEPINTLLATLGLILLFDPTAVASLSLWLSFMATAALLLWAGRTGPLPVERSRTESLLSGANCKTRERRSASPRWPIPRLEFRSMEQPCSSFHPENRLNVGSLLIHPEFCNWLSGLKFISAVKSLLWISLLATFATLPLIVATFGRVPIYSLPANMIMVPLYALLVMPCGLLAELSALVGLDRVALALMHLAGYGVEIGLHMLSWIAALPAGVLWASYPAWWMQVFYGVGMAASAVLLWRGKRGKAALCALLVVVAWLALVLHETDIQKPQWMVWDVGQGAASTLLLPGNRVLAVDVPGRQGSRFNGGTSEAAGLRRLGITHLDVLALSHAQSDHLGGALSLMKQMNSIGELWLPDAPSARTDRRVKAIVRYAQSRGATVRWLAQGDDVWLGQEPGQGQGQDRGLDQGQGSAPDSSINISVLWPPRGFDPANANNTSLVLAAHLANGSRILWPGDIEREAETAILAAGIEKTDVMLMPHHGSNTSSTQAFVDALHADIAIAQAGFANRYHFPKQAVVQRYQEIGAEICNTASGACMVGWLEGGRTARIETWRPHKRLRRELALHMVAFIMN